MTNGHVKTVTVKATLDNEEGVAPKGKVEKKSGKRIGYNYIIVKSLKESRKNDVVKCFYIKGLTKFGFCVIKEGSYGDTKDKHGRDIKDRLIWQKQLHELLQNKVRMPKVMGSFEENGNYYLVMEYIKGKPLYEKIREDKNLRESLLSGGKYGMEVLRYLEQVVEILIIMHKHGIVHRDVTAGNFMVMPGGKVAVIDLELSYSLDGGFPDPPFQLGTHGYMSPEQESVQTPTIKEDVFSVGAMLLLIWNNMSPRKLTDMEGEDLQRMVRFFVPETKMADLVLRCLSKEPSMRPEPDDILRGIRTFIKERQDNRLFNSSPVNTFGREGVLHVIQEGINTLGTSLMADSERGWFAQRMNEHIESSVLNKAYYASLNRGCSGILYFLCRAKALGFDISGSEAPIQQSIDLIKLKYFDNLENSSPGLHFGSDGVALALAEILKHGLITETEEIINHLPLLLQRSSARYGIMNGLAGQGLAAMACKNYNISDRLHAIAGNLRSLQLSDHSWSGTKDNYDFGNGMAGIVYFLLQYGQMYDDKAAIEAACNGLDNLLLKVKREGGHITWFARFGRSVDLWWCEGKAGISLAFLYAYEITREERYREFAGLCLEGHAVHMIWKNLSQCHGLAGLGELYLEAYAILKEEKWLKLAGEIMQIFMHTRKKHKSKGAFWLVENEPRPVAGLMVGCSGVLHFLIRYCYPGKFGYPALG